MQVVVIGGGAAGVCAAIAAARGGACVTILERNAKLLKKLSVTGNGRGNLMNLGAPVYYGDASFADAVFSRASANDVRAFLEGAGVTLTADAEGRVYPAALMASVVSDALTQQLKQLKVSVRLDSRVTAIERRADGGLCLSCAQAVREAQKIKKNGKVKTGAVVEEKPYQVNADRVILAVGGSAAPIHGTDGSAYSLATSLGHKLIPPRPALCALTTDPKPIEGLAGQRVRARLTLAAQNGTALHQSEGEALFTEDGVSGIAAMQLARFIEYGCMLVMDMRQAMIGDADADARAWLENRAGACGALAMDALFCGAAVPSLGQALLNYARVACAGRTVSALTDSEKNALAGAITGFSLTVTGTRGFEHAQVTAGGLSTVQFDPQTLASSVVPGLYAAGEALNVDGDCGGYNLMFAFASGLLAGRSSAV